MFYVSEVKKEAPEEFKTDLNKRIYEVFEELNIPFERVDCDITLTMEDCLHIDKALDIKTAKTLFLCNRQKTKFYVYVTEADSVFNTKDFGKALEISRVSFASNELLGEKLQTKTGAATVFGTLMDNQNEIQVILSKKVIENNYICCTDGTTTGYIKIETKDLLEKILPYAKHEYKVIDI